MNEGNVQEFKIIPFILFIISILLLLFLLSVFTGFKYLPNGTVGFLMHFSMLCYIFLQITNKEISFNSNSVRGKMSVLGWVKYLSFPFLIKLYFTAIITTLLALFIYLFPSVYELLIGWVLRQD